MTKVALVLIAVIGWSAAASAQTEQIPQSTPEVATETLVIKYQPEDLVEQVIIDSLAPATVLTIHATGFDSDRTGFIRQCVSAAELRCRNELPVRFDEFGAARFQYLITDGSGAPTGNAASCRLSAERCTIELWIADKKTIIDTVFVDEAPSPGRIDVTPTRDIFVGGTMSVTVSKFGAGDKLIVMLCAGSSIDRSRCGAPGPVVQLTVGSDGSAQADLTLDDLNVGSDRVTCGRQISCNLVVTSDRGNLRARPVQLGFAAGPGADYDPSRVTIGLGVAVVLAAAAGWLIRSTDWTPPSESDSTPIDEAEYADLDAEADQYELGAR